MPPLPQPPGAPITSPASPQSREAGVVGGFESSEERIKRPLRVGVFDDVVHADEAVVRLTDAGFPKDDIIVVAPAKMKEHYEDFHAKPPAGTFAKKAAGPGAAIGAALGTVLAAAVVVGTGGTALAIAGPIITGAAAGGVWGGFLGAMLSRGFENEAARFYDQAVRKGKILVGVESHDREMLLRAERILGGIGTDPVPLREE